MVTARQAPPIASPTRLSSIHRHRRQTPDQTPDQAAEGEEVPRRLAAPAASPSAGISISGWAPASRIGPDARGFRAVVDVQIPPGQTADLRIYLKAGPRALTETWLGPVRG